jgi:hypothetical protein
MPGGITSETTTPLNLKQPNGLSNTWQGSAWQGGLPQNIVTNSKSGMNGGNTWAAPKRSGAKLSQAAMRERLIELHGGGEEGDPMFSSLARARSHTMQQLKRDAWGEEGQVQGKVANNVFGAISVKPRSKSAYSKRGSPSPGGKKASTVTGYTCDVEPVSGMSSRKPGGRILFATNQACRTNH